MTHRIREAVILITSSSARVHGRRTKLGIRRRSICVAHFTGLCAVTEPTSEQRNDEADKTFQTGGADSRAGGKRCTDWLGGDRKCQGGDHHQSHNVQSTGTRPHFVISGQPANVKRVTRTTKTKELAEKKKGCGKIIVPTAECGVSSKNPVGNTIPTLPSHADGSKLNPKGSSPGYTTVTLSNGVTTSAIFNGKGLTVTSTSPGTITVSNGTNSVTMPGGSMNLSGAVSVQAGAGVQLVRHPNGDVTVAANPTTAGAPAKPTAGANNGPPGVTFTDDLKAVGKSGAAGPTLTAIGVATVWLGLGGAAIGSVVGKPQTLQIL
jgi:hypothetical protein